MSDEREQDWKARLARAAARRARAEVDFLLTVAEIGEHVPQTHIAAALHTNQSNVSRWAARGRDYAEQIPAGQLARTPYEVIQRYVTGEIARDLMLQTLITWPYDAPTPIEIGEWQPAPAPNPPGSFEATVGRALDDGLLSDEDYDAIVAGLASL